MWSNILPWIDNEAVEKTKAIYSSLSATHQPATKKLIRALEIYDQLLSNLRNSVIIMANTLAQSTLFTDLGVYNFLWRRFEDKNFVFDPVRQDTCSLIDAMYSARQTTQNNVENCIDTFLTDIEFKRNATEREVLALFTSFNVVGLSAFEKDFSEVLKDVEVRTTKIHRIVTTPKSRDPLYGCIHVALQECNAQIHSIWGKAYEIFHIDPQTDTKLDTANVKAKVQ